MIRIPLFSSSLMLRQCWNGQEPSEDPVLCHQNSLQGWLWWKRISCIWKTLQFTLSSILPHLVSCNSHNSEEETYSSVNEILYSNLAQINIPISPASLSWNKKSYCQCEQQECQQGRDLLKYEHQHHLTFYQRNKFPLFQWENWDFGRLGSTVFGPWAA